jgi:hypothetical protein
MTISGRYFIRVSNRDCKRPAVSVENLLSGPLADALEPADQYEALLGEHEPVVHLELLHPAFLRAGPRQQVPDRGWQAIESPFKADQVDLHCLDVTAKR